MSNQSFYLEHHGIKGQKWGVRSFQNIDGSLTAEGKLHAEQAKQSYSGKLSYKRRAYRAKRADDRAMKLQNKFIVAKGIANTKRTQLSQYEVAASKKYFKRLCRMHNAAMMAEIHAEAKRKIEAKRAANQTQTA